MLDFMFMKQYPKSWINKKVFLLVLALSITATACASIETRMEKSTGQIFLYGEIHGVPRILNKQLEIWRNYYHNRNMRHMFIEFPYFTAEFLNMWMQSENDDILYKLFDDWVGSCWHSPHVLMFFKTIKNDFPETIFHGVDILVWHAPTGIRFLQHLKDNNMQGTEQYLMTLETLKQGERFYDQGNFDFEFRVTAMTENFIRAFDRLGDQNVMGIFGKAHISLGYRVLGLPDIPTLAERLRERYGDSVHAMDLAWLTLLIDPIKIDIISLNGVDYEVSYFGTCSAIFRDVVLRSFWRLENAYDDFSGSPTNGDWIPFNDYPMVIKMNQVIIVDFMFTDGSIERVFFRSSEGEYLHGIPNGLPITIGFSVD